MPKKRLGGDGQIITFVLALGTVRQVCRLATTFHTQTKALSYLRKNRTEFERIARTRVASGELDAGVVELTML